MSKRSKRSKQSKRSTTTEKRKRYLPRDIYKLGKLSDDDVIEHIRDIQVDKKWRYPYQEQNYRENIAMQLYEFELGHFDQNVTDYDKFLQLTEPDPDKTAEQRINETFGREQSTTSGDPPANGANGNGDDNNGGSGGGDEPPANEGGGDDSEGDNPQRKRKRSRATKKEMRERYQQIEFMLLSEKSTKQIADYAKETWKIGRRSVQLYIKKIREKWAHEASHADYLSYLWKSKKQRDLVIASAIRRLEKDISTRELTSLLRATNQFLNNRDELMEKVVEHRRRTRRDESPDSKIAKARRCDMMVMPIDEFWERLENMRNTWFWEWEQHHLKEWTKRFEKGRDDNNNPHFKVDAIEAVVVGEEEAAHEVRDRVSAAWKVILEAEKAAKAGKCDIDVIEVKQQVEGTGAATQDHDDINNIIDNINNDNNNDAQEKRVDWWNEKRDDVF